MTQQDNRTPEVRRRQKARAIVTALLLGAFVLLVYGITIARMTGK